MRRGWVSRWAIVLLPAIVGTSQACFQEDQTPDAQPGLGQSSQRSPVFTPAHPRIADAVRDFFGVRPTPEQPIEFPHQVHIESGLGCTDYCHEGAAQGPVAGLPSINTCMLCHRAIAVDAPLIKELAAYEERGEDLAWQRVYGYSPLAHVRFNHAPHLRADVECATCHGDVGQQTVAERSVDLTMEFCVNCHEARSAPNECVTCHF